MITGKDQQRIEFAKQSVKNFQEQTYPNKKLIIINHNSQKIIQSHDPETNQNITEIYKSKNNTTLGQLRNYALDLVPDGALFTTWDDDDYRIPSYLSQLYSKLVENNADLVTFTRRTEFNSINKYVWTISLDTGFVTILARKDSKNNIKYLDKDSMEDVDILTDYRKYHHKIYTWANNEPDIYIRTVHGNNTSLYVNKTKANISEYDVNNAYNEYEVSDVYKSAVAEFMSNYYAKALSCI
jgi:hypothetical protein